MSLDNDRPSTYRDLRHVIIEHLFAGGYDDLFRCGSMNENIIRLMKMNVWSIMESFERGEGDKFRDD